MRTVLLAVLFAALLGACGASTSPGVDAGPDAGAHDTGAADAQAADAPADDASATCADASEGEACASEGAFCGGPCTDECSFCNLLACREGTWQRMEAFPLPCYECGPELRCVTGEQYCQRAFDDTGMPDFFECRELPSACTSDVTCTCLEAELTFDRCVMGEGEGELEVQFFGG